MTDGLNGKTAGLKVMCSLAVVVAFRRWILPEFEAASGIALDVSWNPTTVLVSRVAEGERADVMVLIDGPMGKLVEEGVIRAESVRPLARASLGLAVARGKPRPDVSSVEALRSALGNARAVAYSRGGASGIFFTGLIERLGISAQVNKRAVIIPEGFTAEKLVTGEADLAFQQISELMSVEGVEILGPLPAVAQRGTDLSVGIFVEAANVAAAEQFVAAVTSSRAAQAYRDGGMAARFASVRAPAPTDVLP
jgi:molybdate transport system substrate-binding protein